MTHTHTLLDKQGEEEGRTNIFVAFSFDGDSYKFPFPPIKGGECAKSIHPNYNSVLVPCNCVGCNFQKYIEKYHRNTQSPHLAEFNPGQEGYYQSEDGDTDEFLSDSFSEKAYDTG